MVAVLLFVYSQLYRHVSSMRAGTLSVLLFVILPVPKTVPDM